jgi:hypothetical protein
MMPVSAGLAHGMQALTLQASASFDGETLVNRAYNGGTGKNLWNLAPAYAPVVKVNGVVSGCAVTPTATDNDVAVAAGVVNINGVAVTVSADAGTLLVRPANEKYAIYALSVAADGTTFTATKGADGDALDWTAYGGAGQPPLCPAANAVIAYIWLYDDADGVIPAAQISAGESANIAYDIDPIRGNVILPTTLPASYTGAIRRPVCASWTSQDGAIMQVVAETENGKIDAKKATINTSPGSAQSERFEYGRDSWTATVGTYKTLDHWMIDQCLAAGNAETFIKARFNSSDTCYYIGKALHTGVSLDFKYGEIKLPFSFQGTGELCRIVG